MNNFNLAVKSAMENCLRDEKGRIILELEVKDPSQIFSNLFLPGKPMISCETGEFIEGLANGFTSDENFVIKVKGDFSPEEKEVFVRGTYEYFLQRYIFAQRELSRNRFRLALLFAVGVFILGASYLFKREIWSEVGNIAAWVLIWRMVDIIAFENRDLVSEKQRFCAFAEAEIEFE